VLLAAVMLACGSIQASSQRNQFLKKVRRVKQSLEKLNVSQIKCRDVGIPGRNALIAVKSSMEMLGVCAPCVWCIVCLPRRGHAAGLDCPEIGPGVVTNLFTDVQVKLVTSGNSADLANEINDLINKLQIEKPNISYDDLTDVIVAAYCPAVANTTSLTASEKWRRMRQFDSILQQQLVANKTRSGNPYHRQRSASARGLP
jgi:hypothetical protein